jgi:hypothetical protein
MGNFKDTTIYDILKAKLGVEKADEILRKIQKGYDEGLRGEKLKEHVNHVLKESGVTDPEISVVCKQIIVRG